MFSWTLRPGVVVRMAGVVVAICFHYIYLSRTTLERLIFRVFVSIIAFVVNVARILHQWATENRENPSRLQLYICSSHICTVNWPIVFPCETLANWPDSCPGEGGRRSIFCKKRSRFTAYDLQTIANCTMITLLNESTPGQHSLAASSVIYGLAAPVVRSAWTFLYIFFNYIHQ